MVAVSCLHKRSQFTIFNPTENPCREPPPASLEARNPPPTRVDIRSKLTRALLNWFEFPQTFVFVRIPPWLVSAASKLAETAGCVCASARVLAVLAWRLRSLLGAPRGVGALAHAHSRSRSDRSDSSVYLVLAEVLDATLITCDAKLARSHGHEARIELLE
jgi:hypothetical protein